MRDGQKGQKRQKRQRESPAPSASPASSASDVITLASIHEAAAGLMGVGVRTPRVAMPELTEQAGVPVYLKLESQQPTGAFKTRGAWTAVRRLPKETRAHGVITYSSG